MRITFFNPLTKTGINKLIVTSLIVIGLAQCAAKPQNEQDFSEITVSNTGTYAMRSPQACYYGSVDPKQCRIIDNSIEEILPGQSQTLYIRANERVRLVFPFDVIQRFAGVVYRPNCHILLDFFAFKEKQYHAKAEIRSPRSDPAQGFNCEVKVFEQNIDHGQKTEMTDTVAIKIRYRVQREGEIRDGYISNYHWQ